MKKSDVKKGDGVWLLSDGSWIPVSVIAVYKGGDGVRVRHSDGYEEVVTEMRLLRGEREMEAERLRHHAVRVSALRAEIRGLGKELMSPLPSDDVVSGGGFWGHLARGSRIDDVFICPPGYAAMPVPSRQQQAMATVELGALNDVVRAAEGLAIRQTDARHMLTLLALCREALGSKAFDQILADRDLISDLEATTWER